MCVKDLSFMAQHNETGKIGEGVAAKFLEKKGFRVIERNYNNHIKLFTYPTYYNFLEKKSRDEYQ